MTSNMKFKVASLLSIFMVSTLINATRTLPHGTTIDVIDPSTCHAALCIGHEDWSLDVDDIAIDQDSKHKRMHIYPNTDSGIAWNDSDDLTTAPVATDHLWVEPMYGVKLLVRYKVDDNGDIERDIYAFPSRKEIYGDTNKRADIIARDAANDAAAAAGRRP